MNAAELLNRYLEAEDRLRDVSLKAHAFIPGQPLHREWLTVERIELIDQRTRERDEAYRAYREATGFPVR